MEEKCIFIKYFYVFHFAINHEAAQCTTQKAQHSGRGRRGGGWKKLNCHPLKCRVLWRCKSEQLVLAAAAAVA